MYATSGRTLYKTSNGGASWITQTTQLPNTLSDLQISPADPNILFAGNGGIAAGGFYRSVDGGINWIQSIAGFGRSKSINAIAVDPANPNLLYAGGSATGLYRSIDTGDTWTLVSSAVPDHYVQSLTVDSGGRVYCGFGGTLHFSNNQGASWPSLNGNLQNIDVFNVVPHPSNAKILYASSLGGAHRSVNGGVTWQTINTGLFDNDLFAMAIAPANPNILYVGTFGGLVYKTADGGNTWTEKSNGLLAFGTPGSSVGKISVHPKNSDWVWTGTFRAFQSFNGGESWSPFIINGRRVVNVVFDPLRPDTLYATANDTLFRTTDRGAVWVVRRTGVRLSSLAIDPNNPTFFTPIPSVALRKASPPA